MASLFSCNCLVLFTDIISQMDMANHSGADYSMLNVHGVSRPQLRKKHQANVPDIGTDEKDVRLPAVPILDTDAFNRFREPKKRTQIGEKHQANVPDIVTKETIKMRRTNS
ncbi:hypothetical protein HanXRQr2_Chr05g0220321 [Helianthus annuus]|uniref:Uncharacterized protein n=1 Tax=Helianthus annuus TaxID=4232 RepID=A0A9K3NMQ3_HELAN|nr:hypothetical protein HanXRQr2_Chr05g0220321 [Helianthus annuus]